MTPGDRPGLLTLGVLMHHGIPNFETRNWRKRLRRCTSRDRMRKSMLTCWDPMDSSTQMKGKERKRENY